MTAIIVLLIIGGGLLAYSFVLIHLSQVRARNSKRLDDVVTEGMTPWQRKYYAKRMTDVELDELNRNWNGR